MKVKIKNKKNDKVVKEVDSKLLGDYLATKEWEKVEKEKNSQDSNSQEIPKNKVSSGNTSNE